MTSSHTGGQRSFGAGAADLATGNLRSASSSAVTCIIGADLSPSLLPRGTQVSNTDIYGHNNFMNIKATVQQSL